MRRREGRRRRREEGGGGREEGGGGEEKKSRRQKCGGRRKRRKEVVCSILFTCYHGNTHLIWTQAPEHNDLLKQAQLVIPTARQFLVLGLCTVIVLLPCLHLSCKSCSYSLEPGGRSMSFTSSRCRCTSISTHFSLCLL